MGRTCGTDDREEVLCWKRMKEGGHLEDLIVEGRTIKLGIEMIR
jgi:hypothetical protein